jgi:transposase
MGIGRTDEFPKEAVRIALTSGLSRRQVAYDLGVGFSTLNKWVHAHRGADVVSAEGRDLARENEARWIRSGVRWGQVHRIPTYLAGQMDSFRGAMGTSAPDSYLSGRPDGFVQGRDGASAPDSSLSGRPDGLVQGCNGGKCTGFLPIRQAGWARSGARRGQPERIPA